MSPVCRMFKKKTTTKKKIITTGKRRERNHEEEDHHHGKARREKPRRRRSSPRESEERGTTKKKVITTGERGERNHEEEGDEEGAMDPRLDCLADVYRCFLTESCPSQSSAVVASVIFSGLCVVKPSEDTNHVRAENTEELTCSCLTLVEKMTSTPTSQPPQAAFYCTETLRTLFQDMDVMSQIVLHFRNEEHIIAHLAAKCVSACVRYHIHTSGTVAPVWLQTCVQAFRSSAPGCELDSCLWSLTDILKQLLKAARREVFGEVVAALDSSLCALCSRFFSEKQMTTQSLVDLTRDQHWKTTFCLLLDLLEVLTASSLITGVCVKSQRLTLLLSSALLTTISCTSWYFVKKRVVLLLKRTVLQKPGEDWALGEGPSIGLKYEHLGSDWRILAETVLSAVAANWLQSVQVESASFFGGTRHVNEGQKADFVILRAVSLLLLKSMELHMQTAEVDSELYGHLQKLWEFLRRCSVRLSESSHICCLVSAVFGEQDDDMMEAAKALMSIFLHHRRCSRLDESDVLEAACASGCNPHCHFLFLLQSISFDHSILLDFLISTETCFLEYFVRYLKYLSLHWQGFTAACRRISVSDSLTSYTCSGRSDVSALTYNDHSQMESVRLLTGSRLVEYESSESDWEDEPEPSLCEDGSFNGSRFRQETFTPQMEQPQGLSLQSVSLQQTSTSKAACDTLDRARLCLSELREVVMRLHAKNLFPYNPSSLLKLLAQVQTCSQ